MRVVFGGVGFCVVGVGDLVTADNALFMAFSF